MKILAKTENTINEQESNKENPIGHFHLAINHLEFYSINGDIDDSRRDMIHRRVQKDIDDYVQPKLKGRRYAQNGRYDSIAEAIYYEIVLHMDDKMHNNKLYRSSVKQHKHILLDVDLVIDFDYEIHQDDEGEYISRIKEPGWVTIKHARIKDVL